MTEFRVVIRNKAAGWMDTITMIGANEKDIKAQVKKQYRSQMAVVSVSAN